MSLSRRELLRAFLGISAGAGAGAAASLAPLVACRSSASRPPLPDGSLVDRIADIGHRIRDRQTVEPAADAWQDTPLVIVGGGMAGLSAAWRLMGAARQDSGASPRLDQFLLLELDTQLGGTSRSGRTKVGPHPWGAHYVTTPMKENRALVRLLDELSIFEGRDQRGEPIPAEQYLCRDPEERVFYYGRWYEGLYLHAGEDERDRAQYQAFDDEIGRLASMRDSRGRRAFALPLAQSSDDAEFTALDRISMARWMDERGFDSPRLRWYVDYACRDDYGARLADTSAWAGLQYYVARVMASGSDYQPVITWPEGNGRLVQHIAEALGERARAGWAVTEIRVVERDGRTRVEIVALTEDGRVARGVRADRVIFAAPQFLARYIVRDLREHTPDHVAAFRAYSPWMVANLSLRERPRSLGFERAWDNVLYQSPALGYVVSTHQRGLDHGPTVITYYYPLLESDTRAGRRRLLEAGYEEWAEVVLSDLERAHRDIRKITERIDIMRWGHAMIRPTPGFIWGPHRRAAAQPLRDAIYFAHSDLSGVALIDEALDNGVRAAEEVLRARGVEQASWR